MHGIKKQVNIPFVFLNNVFKGSFSVNRIDYGVGTLEGMSKKVSNAIKFTPEKGEVSLGVNIKNEIVEVFVKDSGMGISKENINQLFGGNYFTTKGTANETGTGLGLMLCKEFLHKNGGEIYVQSEEGKGSVFSFTLPKA